VTEHLAQLEREKFLVRQGRQLIVLVAKLQESIGQPAQLDGRQGERSIARAPSAGGTSVAVTPSRKVFAQATVTVRRLQQSSNHEFWPIA
jgi:hypothetical protein